MKPAISLTTMNNPGNMQLLWALKPATVKPVSNFTNQAIPFFKDLVYQLNKEDEFDKTLYWEEEENEPEDEFDSDEENARDNYETDYEYDYHRHK